MIRSMLFVPGDQPRKIQKAFAEISTDSVILDLEDAVAVSAKSATRAPVAEATATHGMAPVNPKSKIPNPKSLYVRVNNPATSFFFGDLDAVVQPGLDAIMLPKTASADELYLADAYVSHLERERGLPPGGIELLPLIESAAGAADLRRICKRGARTGRVKRIGFGATDYTTDVGATWTEDESELLHVCSQMVLYSREAGLEPPIDTVYPHFRDAEGYEARCRRSRTLGFGGRMCIHPDQVEPTNRIYRPTEQEIAWARDVVAAFEEAEAQGIAALTVRGQLVDYAFVVRARQLLARAGI